MHDLPHLPCNSLAPMALSMSMWMHVYGIKIRQHKINPNSNMLKQTSSKTSETKA